jgi:hypothetical protein
MAGVGLDDVDLEEHEGAGSGPVSVSRLARRASAEFLGGAPVVLVLYPVTRAQAERRIIVA